MLEVRPLAVVRVTSPYGPRVIGGEDDFHEGTDFAADESTPLYAMGSGVVQRAGNGVGGDGGGLAVAIIDDDDGQLYYLHMSRIDVVQGQRVVAGQQIGMAGRTGRVTGPHLHLQWRPNYPDLGTADIGPLVASLPAPSGAGGDDDGGGGLVGLAAAVTVGGLLWALTKKRRR